MFSVVFLVTCVPTVFLIQGQHGEIRVGDVVSSRME